MLMHPGSRTSSSICKRKVSSIEEKLKRIKYFEKNESMCHLLSNKHKEILTENHQRQFTKTKTKKSMANVTSSVVNKNIKNTG